MADDSVATISGIFGTREAAELAIEHLVQQHGIDRADVFVQAHDTANTAGSTRSGGDEAADQAEGSSFDPALRGRIEVSADIAANEVDKARQAFRDAGGTDIRLD